jgi:hypothetical protein
MKEKSAGELLARLIVTVEGGDAGGYTVGTLSVRAAGRELVLEGEDGDRVSEWRGGGRRLPAPAFCAAAAQRYRDEPAGPVDARATVQMVTEWFEARPGGAVRFAEWGPGDYAEARRVYEGLEAALAASRAGRAAAESAARAEEEIRDLRERAGAEAAAGGGYHGRLRPIDLMLADSIIALGRVDAADGGGGRVKVEVLKHRAAGPRPAPVYLRMGEDACRAAEGAMEFLRSYAAGAERPASVPASPRGDYERARGLSDGRAADVLARDLEGDRANTAPMPPGAWPADALDRPPALPAGAVLEGAKAYRGAIAPAPGRGQTEAAVYFALMPAPGSPAPGPLLSGRILPPLPIPGGRCSAFAGGWQDRESGLPRPAAALPPEARASWQAGWDARQLAAGEG